MPTMGCSWVDVQDVDVQDPVTGLPEARFGQAHEGSPAHFAGRQVFASSRGSTAREDE